MVSEFVEEYSNCMSEFVYCACVNAVSVNTLNRLIQDLECVVQVCQCRSLLSQ